MSEITTFDLFFNGQLRLFQPKKGHRAGTDAVLLAAACPIGHRIADLGAGVGAVGLRAAQRHQGAEVVLIDADVDALALARQNRSENGLEQRVSIVEADVMAPAFAGPVPPCAVVLTNPPFDEAAHVRVSPDPRRAAAHVLAGTLENWLKAAMKCLTPDGTLVLIHRADALERVLTALRGRAGDIAILPVHPRAEAPASRILVSAKRGSKAPLRLLPALVLHQPGGAFTPGAEAIHRGELALDLDQQTR